MHKARIDNIIPYLGFGVIVLAVKLGVIALYGNATPFWDQWDAEADTLYRPWLEGSLTWADLFAPHNEHRIVTTRLLALGLLELNGKLWDPILQMQVNAVLHVFALSVLLVFLNKDLLHSYRTALIIFSAALFSIPYGWANILAGFQSSFYFLLLFSFIFLWAMAAYKTYTVNWWVGAVSGGLCLFTLASGVITLLAGAVILTIRRFIARDKDSVGIHTIVLLIILAMVAMRLTPNIPGHDTLKASSVTQFIRALAEVVSWPVNNIATGNSGAATWYKLLIGFLVIQAPLLINASRFFHRGKWGHPVFLFLLGMTLWVFGQFITIAYGRAEGANASRYKDLFAIGLVLNFSALLYLIKRSRPDHVRLYGLGIVLWASTIAVGFSASAGQLRDNLRTKGSQGIEQEKNVRAYLCTGDIGHLQNKPFLFVPYPDPEKLKSLLDNPNIRTVLPGNIYLHNSRHPIGQEGEPFCNQEP